MRCCRRTRSGRAASSSPAGSPTGSILRYPRRRQTSRRWFACSPHLCRRSALARRGWQRAADSGRGAGRVASHRLKARRARSMRGGVVGVRRDEYPCYHLALSARPRRGERSAAARASRGAIRLKMVRTAIFDVPRGTWCARMRVSGRGPGCCRRSLPRHSLAPGAAFAALEYNFQPPVTPMARQILDLHSFIFWVCVVIFVVVFGVMFYSIFKHRKSIGRRRRSRSTRTRRSR